MVFTKIKSHQFGSEGQGFFGGLFDSGSASVVVRIVLEVDVAKVQDGRDGGVNGQTLLVIHSQVFQVLKFQSEKKFEILQNVESQFGDFYDSLSFVQIEVWMVKRKLSNSCQYTR